MHRSWSVVFTLLAAVVVNGCAGSDSRSPAGGSPAGRSQHPAHPALPSDAAGERTYVRGVGPLARHWDDEGLLGENLPSRSDLVALWQAVLWADGYVNRSRIDCFYDEATIRATRAWQSNRGLPADGIIGAQTFGEAGERLTERGGAVYYEGAKHSVAFRRADDGRYLVKDAGRFKPLHRYRPTLDVCAERPG